MANVALNFNVDLTNRDYNENENYELTQGGGPYNFTISLTNNGTPFYQGVSVNYDVYLITSDSLDYRKTVIPICDGTLVGENTVISLTNNEFRKLCSTKGYCQIVVKANNYISLPFNFYVVENPIANLE